MKNLIILTLALVLFGCGSDTSSRTSADTDIDSQTIETVGFGEVCGGMEDIKCSSKLMCKRKEPRSESTGTCVDTVVDKDLNCDQTKAPVCGLKDRQKNGYLNECEANRHGAKIINNGFCKKEPEKENNCKAQVLGVGNCEIFMIGYEFDGGTCQEVSVSGCEAEIPFTTMKECQMECL